MRKTLAAVIVATVVPAGIILPTVTPVWASPHPVAPRITSRALTGVDAAALRALTGSAGAPAGAAAARAAAVAGRAGVAAAVPAVLTAPMDTGAFQLVGVTWDAGQPAGGLQVSVRVRDDVSGWGGWEPLAASDGGPDLGSVDAKHAKGGTEPLVAGPSSGVQVRVDAPGGRLPRGLRLQLVDPGTSSADAAIGATGPASSAQAATAQPPIVTRAQWGADESLRNGFAGYSDTIKVGFVHHTTSSNSYTSTAGAAAQIRAIYAYDTNGLGWSDIAYNFLVDKFGTIYEGRGGGVTLPVIGAHTAGFNNQSFAVSALGCFDSTCAGGGAAPSTAMVNSISRVLAWKLGLFHRDPTTTEVLTSSGITGTNLHHPAGQLVRTPTVSGHRDVDATACPGNRLYPFLPTIRTRALAMMGAGFADPALSAAAVAYGGAGPATSSQVIATQSWRQDVLDVCRGGVVSTATGTASRAVPVSTRWAGTRPGGGWALPGPYSVRLSGSSATASAVPWAMGFAVNAPPPDPEPAGSAATGTGGYVPLNPTRLLDTRGAVYSNGASGRVDLAVLGRGGVPASGVTAVALTVTATCPTAGSYLSVAPTGTGRSTSSNLNVRSGQTRAALVVAPVGAGGQVSLWNAAGTTQMVVDVVGYVPVSGGAQLTPLSLTRVYDTRSNGAGKLGNNQARVIPLPALGGLAAKDIRAVVANLTVYGSTASGYLSAYPGGSTWSGSSAVNYPAATAFDGSVVVGVSGGSLVLRNTGPAVDVAVDVTGVLASAAAQPGARLTAITPQRLLDSRLTGGALAPGAARVVAVAGGTSPVPAGATAVLVNLTGVSHGPDTNLIAWPTGQAVPGGAFLRLAAGDVRANAAVVALAADGTMTIRSATGSADVIVDVMGYYG